LGIVHTVVADPAGDHPGLLVNSTVEMAAPSMAIAVARPALVRRIAQRWTPGKIVEKVSALLAIQLNHGVFIFELRITSRKNSIDSHLY
jgi:hypothetical protein